MRRSQIDARLAELYAQVPQPNCKGLCSISCGPINMHPRERQRIRDLGVTIPHHQDALDTLIHDGEYTCPALKDDRCTVYDDRPMICRLWGSVDGMPCPYGCQPDGGRLSIQEGARLQQESVSIGVPDTALLEEQRRIVAERLANPVLRRAVHDYIREHRPRRGK